MSNLKNNYIDWRKNTGQNVFSLIPITKKGNWSEVVQSDLAGPACRKQSGSTMKNCIMSRQRGRASLNC